MQDYDNTLKYLSDQLPHHYVDLVFEECKGDIALLDRELPSTKRESDCLIKVSDTTKHTEFILHLEFQSSYDANMPHRMLSYYARILDKYKLPVYPVVICLYPNRPGLDIPDSYVSSINNKDILTFKFDVLKIWEIEANRIIDSNLYGLFPILPLVNHGKTDDKDHLAECFDLVKNLDIEDDTLKADIYLSTGILAGLRYSKKTIKNLMKVELLKESVIYQDILNKGRNEGRNEGRKEGMEKGMEESIIRILSKRFGNISPGLADIIYHAKNKSQLHKLIDLALSSNNISEFEKKIQKT